MLLIYLLNNSQQQCLLTEMDRLLEKHPYAIDAFIVYFSSIMFAKTKWIERSINTSCCFSIYLLQIILSSIMFAKTNGSTVGETPL